MTQILLYDAIIIGAGQAGGPLSTALASAGWKTSLIEREDPGGTCVNEGCTPTQTMVASARIAYLARRAASYGVQTGPVIIHMAVVRQRKREIVQHFRRNSERQIEITENLDLLKGEAHFISPKTVEVRLEINIPNIYALGDIRRCANRQDVPCSLVSQSLQECQSATNTGQRA
jgi:pyruvate/2-oxoglutarate dehydrogenase complex dihydrolipoamide dehydrogenase (E3) component